MESRKFIFKETARMAVGQALCVGVMLGVFALLGEFSRPVLLGGIFGGLLAILNFFLMAVVADLAADKAEQQNVKGGEAMMRSSYLLRMVVLFVILFALIKSGLCNVITAVLPLAFVKPILIVGEFFRKKGDA